MAFGSFVTMFIVETLILFFFHCACFDFHGVCCIVCITIACLCEQCNRLWDEDNLYQFFIEFIVLYVSQLRAYASNVIDFGTRITYISL